MSLYILVLAGGRSSRMGQDKAKLTMNKQHTLLQHMLELVAELAVEQVYISRPYQQQSGDLALTQMLTGLNAQTKIIYDPIEYQGPLAGIQACVKQLSDCSPNSQLLVLPIDMPALALVDLQQLVKSSQQKNTSCYFAHHFLPVSFYDLAQLQQLLNQLMLRPAKEKSFRNLLNQLPAMSIEATDSQLGRLINLNTPEQWQSYLANRN
ncbi:molybdenum cofactor guanylyltransferase [Catenovulum agarivorans]|uniref:molybdenum cofactor guanylyltransferase n=1 Tax=Catenovulum agarivorans TaxID=1172192 RepID=UPI00035F47F1|nr:molybdenum cofactor guanylyltransferase [Catenovulum agarivorans]